MKITDLPEDILSIIFLLLDPKSFLALCTSTKVLHSDYQRSSLYWRTKVATTFRTPISPLLKADGNRWYSLYQRLKTQTRLYTWGQGIKGALGQGLGPREAPVLPNPPPPQPGARPHPTPHPALPRGPPGPRGRGIRGRVIPLPGRPHPALFKRANSDWPTEAHVPNDISVIADLQCGGWSTTILSSEGKLYTAGCINAKDNHIIGEQTDRFERLEYLTQSTSAIAHFSAGRSHILALTDDGEVVSWDRIDAKGLKVHSRYGGNFSKKPTRVAAGWGESSAYVPEIGLVYWTPIINDQQDEMLDAREVKEKIIPNTARRVSADGAIDEVLAHVVLEGVIIWCTSDSKVWACDIGHTDLDDTEPRYPATQIPGFSEDTDPIRDIQGSFRRFVVFTASGKVLAGDVDYIQRCQEAARRTASEDFEGELNANDPSKWSGLDAIISSRPRDVRALQDTGVISVRFGDWHYHALHSNGTITSHGHEPQSCGCLGLGESHTGGKLRGMISGPQGSRQDTKLRPVADIRGRQIWFEHEKREWLRHLQHAAEEKLAQAPDGTFWRDILYDPVPQTMFSEWIEQEGRHWDEGPANRVAGYAEHLSQTSVKADDGLKIKSHFALAIGAAGWHSGALVIVDQDMSEEVRQKWMIPKERMAGSFDHDEQQHRRPVWEAEDFPRIEMPNGLQMPLLTETFGGQTLGSAFRPWRDGKPTMQDLGLETQ